MEAGTDRRLEPARRPAEAAAFDRDQQHASECPHGDNAEALVAAVHLVAGTVRA
jgi:hypothetical protein